MASHLQQQQRQQQAVKSQTLQQINRLVSASSPSDALDSIHALTSSLSSATSSPITFENILSLLAESNEFMKMICMLLSESKLQLAHNKNRRMIDVEDADVAVLSFLTTILGYYNASSNGGSDGDNDKENQSKNPKLLLKFINAFEEKEFHQSLSIIHSLLDIISHDNSNGNSSNPTQSSSSLLYKQSTTISVLTNFLKLQPTPTINTILQTPHGLNRIIDLFKNNANSGNEDDEKIVLRNDSIILAIELVKLNPGVSKFMIFEDVYDSIMSIASFEYRSYLSSRNIRMSSIAINNTIHPGTGDISNANLLIVKDCLELCIQMTKQEKKMGSDTFLSNPMTCQVLTMLMDLRNGIFYRDYSVCLEHYETNQAKKKKKNGHRNQYYSQNGGSGSNVNHDDDMSFQNGLSTASSEDGLDDILLDSSELLSSSSKPSSMGNEEKEQKPKTFPIPLTTNDESQIISYALRLTQLLIQGGDEEFEDVEDSSTHMMIMSSASRDSSTGGGGGGPSSSSPAASTPGISQRLRSIVSSKNTHQLSMLLFDMALYTLPPPNSPIEYYVSAVPSVNIQCQAMSVMADLAKIAQKISKMDDNSDNLNSNTANRYGNLLQEILNCPSIYLKDVGCLERVMYLICTGGISFAIDDEDNNNNNMNDGNVKTNIAQVVLSAKKISMHSLGLLRSILTPKEASVMVMHTLVPPTDTTSPENSRNPDSPDVPPQEISVVQKLVNTMGENLHLLNHATFSKDLKIIDKERMQINIMGAAGALGVFLSNGAGETTREMLLRVPLPPPPAILRNMNGSSEEEKEQSSPTLIECIMTYLEMGTSNSGISSNFTSSSSIETSDDVTLALLRLIMEWIPKTPQVISAVLSSPNSVSLGFLLQQKSNSKSPPPSQAMTGVLLGLCMEYMGAEDDVGGWSTSSIMNLINVGLGVGKFTQLLESLKRVIANENNIRKNGNSNTLNSVGPWTCCAMERITLLKWYSGNVNIVRRKVVQELSLSSEEDESDNESENVDNNNIKAMKKLVAHQSSEIENLRQQLAVSQETMATQGSEMNMLKRRIGSNPNKVDDLLDEYSAKILLLEIQIRSLKEEMTKNNSKNQSLIKEQCEEISKLKSDLDQSHTEREKIVVEKEAIKEEMTGLSAAYSNLESEYNRVTSNNSSEQANGDVTAEAGEIPNVAFEALKSENMKLKSDIHNANDWMGKAVKKMDDLKKHNSSLEAKIENLSKSGTLNGSQLEEKSHEIVRIRQQLDEVTAERDNLRSEAEYEQNAMKFQLDGIAAERDKIRLETEYKQNEMKRLLDEVIADRDNLRSGADSERHKMKHQMVEVIAERDKLRSEIEHNQNEMKTLNESLEMLQTKATDQKDHEEEVCNLQAKLNQLQSQMVDEKNSLSGTIDNLRDQLSQRDKLIENMKNDHDTKPAKESEMKIEKLEREHTQLSTAYKEAQEWMATAVKHNENLKKQVDLLKNENSTIKSNLEATSSQKNIDLNSLKDEIATLKKEKKEVMENQKAFEEKLTASSTNQERLLNENEKLKMSLEEASSQSTDISNLRSKLSSLEEEIVSIKAKRDEAMEAKNQIEIKFNESVARSEKFSDENSKLNITVQDLSTRASEVDVLKERSNNLQNDLQNERQNHLQQVNKLQESLIEQDKQNKQIQEQLNALMSESNMSDIEREEKNAALTELESTVAALHQENESLILQKDEHLATIEEMQNRLCDFQTWTDTAQEKFAEVDAEKQSLFEQITMLETNETRMKQECTDTNLKFQEITKELEEKKQSFEMIQTELEKSRSEVLSLQVEIGNLDGKNRALSEDNKVLEKTNAEMNSKADLLDEVEESLFEKENEVAMLQNELVSLKEKFESIQGKSEDAMKKRQEQIEELESTVREKETQLIHQEAEAREAISKWEERCEAISTEIARCKDERDEVERSFLKLETEISSYHVSIKDLNKKLESERDQKALLTKQIEESESAFKEHIQELETAIQEHIEANGEFEAQLDERDEALVQAGEVIENLNKELLDNRKDSENVVAQWQENGELLQATITELEATIETQGGEANVAITLWEERYNTLIDQIAELEETHDNLRLENETFKNTLSAKETECNEVNEKVYQLSGELEMMKNEKETSENKIVALKKNLDDGTKKIQDQSLMVQNLGNEKAAALKQLESEKNVCSEIREAYEKEKTSNKDLEKNLQKTTELLQQTRMMRDKIEQAKIDTEELFEEERNEIESRIQTLEEEKRYLEESNEIDRAEANEMKLIIGQLENELKEANDMLQSYLTDEVTARATEMATNALRAQLKQSREKQSFEHEAYICEKDARISAEQEVEKLKSDLALLIQVENFSDASDARMQQLTSKAAGEVLVRQREDIDALTKSLEELMFELQSCQFKEREAEERAANSRLHASACEQELLAAKSDISLLKESMELLRRDESELRETLENRVNSLKEEREIMIQAYGNDVKNLKVEISQGQMERDRLIHALNESEKANSALVLSTTVDQGENDSSMELELAKLRLEKAQLLAVVQENRSKAEQRIRSVFSGESEKNTTSEKELIEAAEKSLKTLQQKYDEVSTRLELANESNAELLTRIKQINVNALKNELFNYQTEVGKLQQMNEELKLQIKQAENEATLTNSKLEEKCRLADAKILELERQERKEAALATELAKVREESKALAISSDNGNGGTSESKEVMAADDMHDFVLELKEVVKEERQMYQDLLAEHEDLLALLAQQDLEKSSLQSALEAAVGQKAVEEAILNAEVEAVEQFGKYIKLK